AGGGSTNSRTKRHRSLYALFESLRGGAVIVIASGHGEGSQSGAAALVQFERTADVRPGSQCGHGPCQSYFAWSQQFLCRPVDERVRPAAWKLERTSSDY